MPNRNNAIAKKGFKNKPSINNNVNFHPIVADLTFKYLKNHFMHITNTPQPFILDACSGINGILGKSLQKIYYKENTRICPLLVMQDILIDGTSILNFKYERKFDMITVNPPWIPVNFAEEIFHYLYNNLLDKNGVMFFICNNSFFYQGWKRALKLNYQKFYFFPRYIFSHAGRKLLDCGISISYKGEIPKSTINLKPFIYIPKNYTQLENVMFDIYGGKNEKNI